MKATIESTSKVVTVIADPAIEKKGEIKARIWEGFTEHGVKFHAYIVRVAVAPDQDSSQFDKELTETRAPSADVAAQRQIPRLENPGERRVSEQTEFADRVSDKIVAIFNEELEIALRSTIGPVGLLYGYLLAFCALEQSMPPGTKPDSIVQLSKAVRNCIVEIQAYYRSKNQ